MEFTVTAQHKGIDVEIEGDNREDIQAELLELAEFIEENTTELEVFGSASSPSDKNANGATPDSTEDEEETATGDGVSLFADISERTRVDEDVLEQLFEVPDDEDEVPFVKLYQFEEGADVLGSARNQQQASGSLLVLYLWQECRGVETVDLETLDNALSYSDIDIERRDAMYQAFSKDAKNWFDSNGSSISLTTRGEHQAREVISELAEDFSSA